MAAVVAVVAVTGAFAQNVCDDLDGATAKYEAFINNYNKNDKASLEAAVTAGKEFLEKWGACESWKDQVAFVKPWIPKVEQKIKIVEEGPMWESFDKAVIADNIDGIYTAGRQILAKYPNNHNIKYVMAVVALTDVSKAVQAKTQSKYSSEGANLAKTLHEGLKSGAITLDRKLKDGTPSIGVLKHETNKEEALSRLVYTYGFVNYYGLNNKKAAVAQYYEVTQTPGYFKNYAPVYVTISDYYRDEAEKIGLEIVAVTKEYNGLVDQVKKLAPGSDPAEATRLDGEIKAKDAQIKTKEALYNGYVERAMDALARAYKAAKDTTPAEKAYKEALYKDLQALYNRRFPTKPAGLNDWVTATTAKPLPDPSSTVQPVSDEPATTTTTVNTTASPAGNVNGTAVAKKP
jgi:hypothetical protein